VSDFDYQLPPERIAGYPSEMRDASCLLELRRSSGEIRHHRFRDILTLLEPGDVLALNDTRVIPARLIGHAPTGGRVELLLLEPVEGDLWRAIGKPGRRLRPGDVAHFGEDKLRAHVRGSEGDEGIRLVELEYEGDLLVVLDDVGLPPLPPYIDREPEPTDRERYQTVYAREPGAVAAPTAGLHFTEELLDEVRRLGVGVGYVTLHVGLGTFRPVRTEFVTEHRMHAEFYRVSPEFAALANQRRGRLVAVGTTVCRTLESVADEQGRIEPGSGHTEIFIYPGYRFRAVEAMVTNFHLPRSTLLMMVSAFCGSREMLMRAYEEALEHGYRFYSYGDAMMIH
jgi:S-adenosylmethionine:tRNA ribosyltransferase-isomerase